MILQRLTTALRKQDWFTVLIETLIVVLGVFLGLQLGNWNERGKAAQEEAVILQQLGDQFDVFIEVTQTRVESQIDSLRATDQLLEVIAIGEAPDNREAFIDILQRSGRLEDASEEPTTLVELVSSGRLSDLSSARLRSQLTEFHQTMAAHRSIASMALQRISDPTTGRHEAIHTAPYTVGEVTDYDWELIPAMRAEQQVLQIGKTHLVQGMSELLEQAQAITAEIGEMQK